MADDNARMAEFREKYPLPDALTIKIRTKGLDQDMLDALRCLLVSDRADLPFELARYVAWPAHQRAIASRAQILLRNGYLDLVEQSAQSNAPAQLAALPNSGAPAGFPVMPRVQI